MNVHGIYGTTIGKKESLLGKLYLPWMKISQFLCLIFQTKSLRILVETLTASAGLPTIFIGLSANGHQVLPANSVKREASIQILAQSSELG